MPDAGLLPLWAFDQQHGLTRGLAERVCDDRDDSRVSHPGLSLLRQRLYQIIAGYEDANDADRLRHYPAFQILADQPLGEPLGSQPTVSRWENSPSPRDLLKLRMLCLIGLCRSAENRFANWERSCWMLIPPTIQRTGNSSSVSYVNLNLVKSVSYRRDRPSKASYLSQVRIETQLPLINLFSANRSRKATTTPTVNYP